MEAPVEGTWVVSCMANTKGRTLHRVGRCWRRPGVHYARFTILTEADMEEKQVGAYHKVCRDCYPAGIVSGGGGEASSDGASTDSSFED
jgi:hypothetical protein